MLLSLVLERLITDLEERQESLRADRHTHTVYLKEHDAREIILNSFATVLKAIERKATLVDMSVSVGRRIMQQLRLPRNSIRACHTGWFVLVSYIEAGLIEHRLQHVKTKRNRTSKYLTYQILVKDKKALMELWDQIVEEENIDLFPSNVPPAPWVSGMHETGIGIVKKSRPGIIKGFSPEKQPIVFNMLNKLGQTAWMVNKPMFEVIEYFINNELDDNPLKFTSEENQQRRESLYIETSSVYRLAKKHLETNFYHLYNTDFRGRVYCNTAL